MKQLKLNKFNIDVKEDNEDNLLINIDPNEYLDYFLEKLKNNIDDIKSIENFLSLDKIILDEYISRFDKEEEITSQKISEIIQFEKELINLCIDKVIEKRIKLIDCKVDDLNYNLGMVYALSDANTIKKRDILYAAANELFVHGTSTSFGFLREAETKKIKKIESNHIFGITTQALKLEEKGSFDLILIKIEKKIVKEIIFIQMSSGPNCKNFTHAIQINNVKDWFNKTCKNSLKNLREFVKPKELDEFDTFVENLKVYEVDPNKIKVIVGQAYGDEGMTTSMMKSAKVEVIRGDTLWELITGIEGVNPFKAEKIAGIIVLNILKKNEPKKTQKMSFWDMIEYKLSEMEKNLDMKDFSID